MRLSIRSAATAMVLVVVGCGGNERGQGDPRQSGELRLEQVIVGTSVYIEGSRSYIRVEDGEGATVLEEELPEAERPTFSATLDPGTYRLRSWQRPCDGNCERLGDPTDQCDRTFDVAAAEVRRATISVRPGNGCEIELG